MADKGRIRVIDQTIREGMQFHGLVFSLAQRLKILDFQETLGVDVCQAGYPPALDREAEIVGAVAAHARKHNYKIRTAALGRATAPDAEVLIQTGVDHPHFHTAPGIGQEKISTTLDRLRQLFEGVKKRRPRAEISLAMLDLGRTDPAVIQRCLSAFEASPGLAVLSLPDTSGILAPNQIMDRIRDLAGRRDRLKLSVHCHNDMGMATANTVTGVVAGADLFEASALGIGERNGIADLYVTAKALASQGFYTGLDIDNVDGFRAYYTYVNGIVREQTGLDLLSYTCPVFGAAVRTHVAGTHARGSYGTAAEADYFLNPLCGRGLVKKYLARYGVPYADADIESITRAVKSASMEKGRHLTTEEVSRIVDKNHLQNRS